VPLAASSEIIGRKTASWWSRYQHREDTGQLSLHILDLLLTLCDWRLVRSVNHADGLSLL
jgi:hypothetical protein